MSHVEFGRILAHSKLHGPERMILSAISYHCNTKDNDGVAWPSIPTIAKEAGYSERQVQRVIAEWIKSPSEAYVIPGGGRKKPHTFIIIVGLCHAEVVSRLTPHIGYEKAVQFADQQNGDIYDTKHTGNGDTHVTIKDSQNGDIYGASQSKTVTYTTQNTPETVTPMSPEPEVLIEPESNSVEPEFFSSSTTTHPFEEKEEIHIPSLITKISNLETEKAVMKFAELIGLNPVLPRIRKAVLDAITILDKRQDFELSDLDSYMEYYRSQKRTQPRPSVDFIIGGWPLYKDWLETRSNEMYGDFLPGTEDYLQVSRGDWRFIKSLVVGDDFTYTDGRGTERHYIKQPDGTFARVEIEQAS